MKPARGAAVAPRLSIGFMLLPQFTLTPFSAMVDVLRLAADIGDRSRPVNCRWDVLSGDSRPIRASCGLSINPTRHISDAVHYDYLVVIGGLLHDAPHFSESERAFIRHCDRGGIPLVGVCTGSFELLKLGLMDGRRCCVSWFHAADLLERFPNAIPATDQLYVDEGDRITCAGGAGAADLAAHLVDRHCGFGEAQKALRILLVDHSPSEVALQPSPKLAPPARNDRVRRALLIMEQFLAEPLSVGEVANLLGISDRQLTRDFHAEFGHGPAEANLRLRLEHARTRLAATARSITEIAHASGFSDAAHFSRQFHSRFKQTPSSFRHSILQRAQ